MVHSRPGWLVALCAAILAVSAWLPWLTKRADGGGRASAIGGVVGNMVLTPRGFGAGQLIVLLASTLIVAGAMAARGLSTRLASAAALIISLLLVALTVWYYHVYVQPPVSAAYGLYIGAAGAVAAVSRFVEPLKLTGQRWVSLEPLTRAHVPEIAAAAADGELGGLWFTTAPLPQTAAQWVERLLAMQAGDGGRASMPRPSC
jgi:hypothetical protein